MMRFAAALARRSQGHSSRITNWCSLSRPERAIARNADSTLASRDGLLGPAQISRLRQHCQVILEVPTGCGGVFDKVRDQLRRFALPVRRKSSVILVFLWLACSHQWEIVFRLSDLVAKPFVVRQCLLVCHLLTTDRADVILDLSEFGLNAAQFHDQATLFADFNQTSSHVPGTGSEVVFSGTYGGEPLAAVEAYPPVCRHWICILFDHRAGYAVYIKCHSVHNPRSLMVQQVVVFLPRP